MKSTEKHMRRIIVAAIIASMAAPTWAMPVGALRPSVSDTVTNIDLRRPSRHRPGHGVRPPHHRPPHYRPSRPPRHHRHSRNNSGAVAAGLIGGMLLGGMAISAARQHNHSAWNNHVNWCSQRYRSYRVSDNSWQPYNGPRRQCISPF
ncbi:BA14K family protein [Mesorhizobium sp. B2-6-1]|nr:BA14K family protein [Mesorhizobium sp. B2-6-4]TPJ64760.1 BA14K family protein [Mesorhizobium sp. B2-6-1]TPJ92419.1 BA14K family protein [Mesorhizobium sp. B2-5-12]TPK21320.1 BA14K family protein [Mesorhizobium sp. B2-5-6]TPK35309.1 BA14K family protein [Mesorhizobium sp. B2-5-3]TPK68891.1 BA14K family protein [Mesorhizobium sp. B2-5-1]TPL07064.1 BA14K family protein [Mesorhizobium sp. B2-4-11]TPM62962.1 BA14K family protein [Mesorhizobium sp. B2-1-9]TPM87875.1 BA14K family protein [Meso